MVSFYTEKNNRGAPALKKAFEAECTGLDLEGRGVVKAGAQVYFAAGIMPDERGKIQPISEKNHTARLLSLTKTSELRCQSDCSYSKDCGGCPLMHLPSDMALSAKAEGIARLFKRNLKADFDKPNLIVSGPVTGYRRACRLAVRADRGELLIGFRKGSSHELTPVASCCCLTERINDLLPELKQVLGALKGKNKLTHIEFLDSDAALGVMLRFTARINESDGEILQGFAKEKELYLSVAEPVDIVTHVHKDARALKRGESEEQTSLSENAKERLIYAPEPGLKITSAGLEIPCLPSSFVQVNRFINDAIIKEVLEALEPEAGDKILDLFCGLGNFTLPLAKSGAQTVGIDIVPEMIESARQNADRLGLAARFYACNLEEAFEKEAWAKAEYSKVILDPGRQGARRVCSYLAKKKIPRVLLVSCNPQATSRDLSELFDAGYKVARWGSFDMFPRTAHIETVIVLSRKK